jgi:hypothetical protein
MDGEATSRFEVHRASNGKFYIASGATAIRTEAGSLVYFDEERNALEFLIETIDIVTDRALGRLFEHAGRHATETPASCETGLVTKIQNPID